MTIAIIITICILVLIAYAFDITSSKTRIPSVLLLLALGWVVRRGVDFFEFSVPDLTTILPILGTVGLILIVLEGTLELKLNRSKVPVLTKSFLAAVLPIFILSFGFALLFHLVGGYSFKNGLANAIPFCIISSSVAIPSVINLSADKREFVIYESSLSDIIGVILFNFLTLNAVIGIPQFLNFFLQLLAIIAISFVTTGALSYLLSKIDHHVKFIPIMLMIILIYAISEVYHLPALIFILVFGLFLSNLDELKEFKLIQRLHPEEMQDEVDQFRDIVVEGAFLIRTLFFLLFGFLMDMQEILNPETLPLALGTVLLIYLVRALFLKLTNVSLRPLLFIAPRGLITILLFLSIPISQRIDYVNDSLIIQVIILTSLIMMVGFMISPSKKPEAKPARIEPARTGSEFH